MDNLNSFSSAKRFHRLTICVKVESLATTKPLKLVRITNKKIFENLKKTQNCGTRIFERNLAKTKYNLTITPQLLKLSAKQWHRWNEWLCILLLKNDSIKLKPRTLTPKKQLIRTKTKIWSHYLQRCLQWYISSDIPKFFLKTLVMCSKGDYQCVPRHNKE